MNNDIQVRVGSGTTRNTKIYGADVTPFQIFEDSNIPVEGSTITLNGMQLTFAECNQTLTQLGVTDSCSLSAVFKTNNAY